MIGRTQYIDFRLQELDEVEAETKDLPCGDERARAKDIIDRIRKEILIVEALVSKNRSTHHVEARIETLFNKLKPLTQK